MSIASQKFEEFFVRSKRNCPSTSSESETSFSSDKPANKRLNMDGDTSVQATLQQLISQQQQLVDRMSTLATKEDVRQMKEDVKLMTDEVMKKLDTLEGQILEVESKAATTEKEIKVVKGKTTRLQNNLNDHDIRMKRLETEMNDLEQYTRRWNLRVYRVPESNSETADDCVKKVCSVFSDLVGVRTVPQDVEVAHRTGKMGDKARPVLVRFFDRKKRDEILRNRRKLKGKGVVVDEDLTVQNYKLLRKAQEHSLSLAVWSANGKILAKLKNGRTLRLSIHSDIEAVFQKAVEGHDIMQNSQNAD
jgi:predicted nuclease with TOPRIM domain